MLRTYQKLPKMKIKYYKFTMMLVLISSMIISMAPTLVVSQNATIKIGGLGPLAITPGEDMKKGAELAVKHINAEGGVNVAGTMKDFELLIESNSGTDGLPSTVDSKSGLDSLAEAGVVAMLGGFRTEVVMGGIEANLNFVGNPTGYEIPFLGVGSTAPIYTPYFWRVGPTNGSRLLMATLGLYNNLMANNNVTNVAVAREDASWTVPFAGGVSLYMPLFSGGGLTVYPNLITPIPQDATGSAISTALDAVVANGTVDAILTIFSAPVGKTFAEQWAAKGLNENTYLAGVNVESQKSTYYVDTQAGAAGEIELESAPPGTEPTVKTAKFRTDFAAEYDEQPTYTSFASYDAVYIIMEAIEAAGADDSASIQTALADTDYVGTASRIKFTSEDVFGQVKSLPAETNLNTLTGYEVHDLYTTSSYDTAGFPWSQPFFAQWLEDGTKVAVYPSASNGLITPVIGPAYAGVLPKTDSDEEGFPGFTTIVSIFSLSVMMLVVVRKRRKY